MLKTLEVIKESVQLWFSWLWEKLFFLIYMIVDLKCDTTGFRIRLLIFYLSTSVTFLQYSVKCQEVYSCINSHFASVFFGKSEILKEIQMYGFRSGSKRKWKNFQQSYKLTFSEEKKADNGSWYNQEKHWPDECPQTTDSADLSSNSHELEQTKTVEVTSAIIYISK